jgi:hypothetical protein
MVDMLIGEVSGRLPLGRDSYESIKMKCEKTLGLLEEWKGVICGTDCDDFERQGGWERGRKLGHTEVAQQEWIWM